MSGKKQVLFGKICGWIPKKWLQGLDLQFDDPLANKKSKLRTFRRFRERNSQRPNNTSVFHSQNFIAYLKSEILEYGSIDWETLSNTQPCARYQVWNWRAPSYYQLPHNFGTKVWIWKSDYLRERLARPMKSPIYNKNGLFVSKPISLLARW